ncbi:hypothetical protein PpBr36_08955, partial [Pyricularia pennisetigena]|uniref:hypothetical protein n=1 Tax=Pyricularia pennisetigena TaxID=1578925 RepID=UPI001153D8A1
MSMCWGAADTQHHAANHGLRFGSPLFCNQITDHYLQKWTMHEERAYHTGGQPTLQTPCKVQHNTKDKFEAVAGSISFNKGQVPSRG